MIALIQRVAEASVRVRGGRADAGQKAARDDTDADRAAAGDEVEAGAEPTRAKVDAGGEPAGTGVDEAGTGVATGRGTAWAGADVVETGRIGAGLLALVCAERGDTDRESDRLLDRVLGYRVFSDEAGRMNRSLLDAGGALLVVSQFTLAADTASGARPSFTPAAPAALGERLYDRFVGRARERLGAPRVATGRFGADMRVALVNDGPVTFWLRVMPRQAA